MPHPEEEETARELTPVQMFWDGRQGIKNFGPQVTKVDPNEVREVEDTITPVPKEEYAPESVDSSIFQSPGAPAKSETPALPSTVLPTEKLEDAVKESGKRSGSSEDEQTTSNPTTPSPASSSPSSSSEGQTKSGSPAPPAPIKPPTSGSIPTQ